MQPTLFTGLGGTGAYVIADVLAKLLENLTTAEGVGSIFQFLYIDADTHIAENLKLPKQWQQNIGFYALPYIQEACQHDMNLKKWFDYEIVRHAPFAPAQFDLTRSTTLYRQFGRIALYHDLITGHFSKVRASIHRSLLSMQQQPPDLPLVVICTSLIGGTGGAIALDVAYLVQHILEALDSDAHVLGVFALSNIFTSALSHLQETRHIRSISNQVAAIKEIQHYARSRYEFGPQGHVVSFNNLEPFESYWLFGCDRSGRLEGKLPTDYFSMIAAELSDAVITGDWVMRLKRLEYVNARAPLTTNIIGDWPYWDEIYRRQLETPNRLCFHISREFCG